MIAYKSIHTLCIAQILLILPPLMTFAAFDTHNSNTIQVERMTLRWHFKNNRLHCQLTSPTRGWVALGFNTRSELEGTHLIMGAVKDTATTLSDRYIIAPGRHQPIPALGGTEDLVLLEGRETVEGTTISFSIPTTSDSWRKRLRQGSTYHLLFAYSMDDDFNHHSLMRRHVKVTL